MDFLYHLYAEAREADYRYTVELVQGHEPSPEFADWVASLPATSPAKARAESTLQLTPRLG